MSSTKQNFCLVLDILVAIDVGTETITFCSVAATKTTSVNLTPFVVFRHSLAIDVSTETITSCSDAATKTISVNLTPFVVLRHVQQHLPKFPRHC